MDFTSLLALSAGLAWASGLRLYLAMFAVGMLGRLGYVTLPHGLQLLQHDWVLIASGIMLVIEFLADKIPGLDTLWDSLQTFIRIPAGAVLAAAALGIGHPALTLTAAIAGGAIASATHLTKAGTRAVINSSPEPVTNWGASIAEDGLVLGGLWLIFAHPVVFLVLLALLLALMAWLLPKLWRGIRRTFGRIAGRSAQSRE